MEYKTTGAIVKRDLDSCYIRVRVDGQWENRCLTDLHWNDVESWLKGRQDADALIRVVKHLHECLRSIGDQLDIGGRHD